MTEPDKQTCDRLKKESLAPIRLNDQPFFHPISCCMNWLKQANIVFMQNVGSLKMFDHLPGGLSMHMYVVGSFLISYLSQSTQKEAFTVQYQPDFKGFSTNI